MSFYTSEQRCPRCRAPLTHVAPACPNCGLALAGIGDAPRASRSGPPPSWQPADPNGYGVRPTDERFGSQRNSGPAMYRPGGQPAPGVSDPGASFQRPSSGYQQRPGTSGGFSGAGNRSAGSGDASTNYQGRDASQRHPSAGWGSEPPYQRAPSSHQNTSNDYPNTSSSYRGSPDGYQNTPFSHQEPPDDSWNTPGSWDNPAGYRRPSSGYRQPPTGWGSASGYRDAPADYPETAAGFYEDEAAPVYGRSQAFRGAPAQSWQQGAFGPPAGGIQHHYFGYFPPADLAPEPPMPPLPGRGKKVALILLIILVLLGGGGAAAYLFIQSRPVIAVTSKYLVGTTPAGAATTSLHVTGTKFAARSAVSFLLDGQPEPGHRIFQSDASGALKGDLPITVGWALGQHTLTAKDASGNTTILGKTIAIVAQGEAGTPGPNGAPADATSFTINLIIHQHDNNSGQDYTGTDSLVITGQPDPAGGTVCNPKTDTGQTQTLKGTSNGLRYTQTFIETCSGTYKGGKITYTQTVPSLKIDFSNGVTCTATAPFVNQELDGSFTNATNLSGTLSSSTVSLTCTNGNSNTLTFPPGTWTGTLSS